MPRWIHPVGRESNDKWSQITEGRAFVSPPYNNFTIEDFMFRGGRLNPSELVDQGGEKK